MTNPWDIAMIVVGAALLGIGTFRTFPIAINRAFWWNNLPLTFALVLFVGLAIHAGGMKYFLAGVENTVLTNSRFFVLMALLMPVIGFSGPVTHHYEKAISAMLAGKFGYPGTLFAAFVSPGGNAFSGAVNIVWVKRPDLQVTLMYFLCVVPLISFTIFYIRRLGLDAEIAMEMYKTNWVVAVCLIPIFWIWGKYFH